MSWGTGVTGGQLPSDFVPSFYWDQSRQIFWVGYDEGLGAITQGRAVSFSIDSVDLGTGV